MRARLGAPQHDAYGATPIEALDIYTTKRPNVPINIFIHGGAWRAGRAKDYALAAEPSASCAAPIPTRGLRFVLVGRAWG